MSCAITIVVSLATACATTPGARPEDMSAAEHREHAAREEAAAREHERAYDPSARAERNTGTDRDPALWEVEVYNPTEAHRARAAEHRQHAAAHRAAAAALEAFEEAECRDFSPQTRAACPLLGTVEAVDDIEGGVRVRLVAGVAPRAVADHVRCHLAFAASEGHAGMPNCPLYVPGVTASLEGGTIELRVGDGEGLAELRRRTHDHVEPHGGGGAPGP